MSLDKEEKMLLESPEAYVVAFEIVGEFGDVYHTGEISFAVYFDDGGILGLVGEIRSTLKLIGQPFIAYKQIMLYARPVVLWKIAKHGKRVLVPLPEVLVEEERQREERRREREEFMAFDDFRGFR